MVRWRGTANCIIIDHFSAFELELVAFFSRCRLKTAGNDSRSFSRFGAIMQFAVRRGSMALLLRLVLSRSAPDLLGAWFRSD
eukprot:COSAG06_NODE_6903_length_2723_cov_3.582317_3_plen_82_part_00